MAPSIYSTASSNSSRSKGDAAASSQRRTNLEQFSPTFRVGERIDVQIRMYIWVPGVVTGMAYLEHVASLIYEIRYVAADGSTLTEAFYPRDVRQPE